MAGKTKSVAVLERRMIALVEYGAGWVLKEPRFVLEALKDGVPWAPVTHQEAKQARGAYREMVRQWKKGRSVHRLLPRVLAPVVEHSELRQVTEGGLRKKVDVAPMIARTLRAEPVSLMPVTRMAQVGYLTRKFRPWFYLHEGLLDRLVSTELVGVSPSEIRLPFDAFFLEFDEGLIQIRDPQTGWHDLRSIAVAKGLPGEGGDPFIWCVFSCAPNSSSTNPMDDHLHATVLELGASSIEGSIPERRVRMDIRYLGVDVGEYAWEWAARLVFNALLYINSKEAEWKADKQECGKKGATREVTYHVGRKVGVSRELREAIRGGALTGKKLRYRVFVRGHWRNQPYGPGNKLRKRIWIEPYVKGPQTAEIVERTYGVK